MNHFTVGSLFSGIGGFDLGFERAGFDIRWMCEIDPYCRKVLRRHWPEVPIYEDIRSIRGGTTEPVDCIIGGFPCQDISEAGKRAGINGTRSGLWWEMYRIIRLLRPRYVAIENVSDLHRRGLDVVLGCLAEIGYDAEWDTLSACMFGAPHMRRRMFVVAYPHHQGRQQLREVRTGSDLSHLNGQASKNGKVGEGLRTQIEHSAAVLFRKNRWASEPEICRILDGPALGVVRKSISALGNSVVPEVAEYIARCIMNHAHRSHAAPKP